MDTIERLARDLLARLSRDYGDGEDCPPEVQELFDRGERLLPVEYHSDGVFPPCPTCGGELKFYDGGEGANYAATLLLCEACSHTIDLSADEGAGSSIEDMVIELRSNPALLYAVENSRTMPASVREAARRASQKTD